MRRAQPAGSGEGERGAALGARWFALQPDGKIVAAGGLAIGLFNDFVVARYNSTSTLDPSFGTGGKGITDFAANNDGRVP